MPTIPDFAFTPNRMVRESEKSRVAIGVFDRLESLSRTLDDLVSRGVPDTTLMLFADAGALDGQLDQTKTSKGITGGVNWPTVITRSSSDPVDPIDRAASKKKPVISPEHDRIANFEQWIEPRMADSLNGQLAKGACLLFAVIATPDQEQKVCRALIEHSIGQVQVHDL